MANSSREYPEESKREIVPLARNGETPKKQSAADVRISEPSSTRCLRLGWSAGFGETCLSLHPDSHRVKLGPAPLAVSTRARPHSAGPAHAGRHHLLASVHDPPGRFTMMGRAS